MIVAIILAAGPSTRMGKPKQTLVVQGEPMLEKVLEVFRRTMVHRVVVVLGANSQQVRRKVRFEKEQVVVNRRYEEGMSGSLKLGLKAAGHDADAVIVALADQPFLSAATVDSLVEGYLRSKAPVVVPMYRRARGNPVLFDKSVFPEIMEIGGDVGAKSVVRRHKDEMLRVRVEDAGVKFDFDTPEDYAAGSNGLPTRLRRNLGPD